MIASGSGRIITQFVRFDDTKLAGDHDTAQHLLGQMQQARRFTAIT